MTKIVFQNSKILTLGGNWIIPVPGVGPLPMYTITIGTSSHGSVSASSLTATEGTIITLTATPDTDYELGYFTLDGIALAGNSFLMPNANVTVSAVFVSAAPTFDEVTIGSQTWKIKNLAIDDGQGGIYTQTVNYGQGDVVEYYYTWDAAVRVAATIQGWRLPTQNDFYAIFTALGNTAGTKLKSTYGWTSGNGTDEYGYCALPSGYYQGAIFLNFGSESRMWTSDQYRTGPTYDQAYCNIFKTGAYMDADTPYKTCGLSVRLIKDE